MALGGMRGQLGATVSNKFGRPGKARNKSAKPTRLNTGWLRLALRVPDPALSSAQNGLEEFDPGVFARSYIGGMQ